MGWRPCWPSIVRPHSAPGRGSGSTDRADIDPRLHGDRPIPQRSPRANCAGRQDGVARAWPGGVAQATHIGRGGRGLAAGQVPGGPFTTHHAPRTALPAAQSCRDIAAQRTRWQAHQGKIDPPRLAFIDETWIKTRMAPLLDWGLHGQRLVARMQHGHGKTLTFMATLRHDPVDVPCVIDGAIHGDLFTAHVEQALVPTLAPRGASSSSATSAFARDVAPAELRTVEASWSKLGSLLDLITPTESANYLVNSIHAAV